VLSPFDPEQERRFFDREVAGLLVKLHAARERLRRDLASKPAAHRALRDLGTVARSLERSLHWFKCTREVAVSLDPVALWPASTLPKLVRERIRSCRLQLKPPTGIRRGFLTIPTEPLLTGLLGTALTLKAAVGSSPRWQMEATPGLLFSKLIAPGDENLVDSDSFLRSYHWPKARGARENLDAGVPYLRAVLGPFGGELELIWKAGLWRLECSIPLIG
jgi:hypothetical protein